jgi:hypothetical protein
MTAELLLAALDIGDGTCSQCGCRLETHTTAAPNTVHCTYCNEDCVNLIPPPRPTAHRTWRKR